MTPSRAIVFQQRADAEALLARLDATLGYPRAGVDIGAGIHVPATESRTLHHTHVREHPSRLEWAVPIDAAASAQLSPAERARVASLPADWQPLAPPLAPASAPDR